jgi:hypothetical protein
MGSILCIIGSLVPKRKASFSFCLSLPIRSRGAFGILQLKFSVAAEKIIKQQVL